MSSSKVHQTRSENELLCAVTYGGTGASLFVWTRVAPLEQQKLWAECDTPQDEKTHHSRHRIRVVAVICRMRGGTQRSHKFPEHAEGRVWQRVSGELVEIKRATPNRKTSGMITESWQPYTI